MLITKKVLPIIFGLILSLSTLHAQGRYLGVYNTTAANPGCASQYCHQTIVVIWETSAHANAHPANSDTYGYNCLECHNTGWDTTVDNGGADEFVTEAPGSTPDYVTSSGWEMLENVQCEACHGPVGDSEGILDWNHTQRVTSYGSATCGGCHNGSHHPYYDEWQASGHASGAPAWFKDRSTNGECFYCHFAQDFQEFLKDPNYDAVNFQIEGDDDNLSDITCVTCHDPHGNSNTANLRDLPEGYEDKVICDVCHTIQEEVKDVHNPPHHATSQVFSRGDEFGWRYPGEDYSQTNSFHTLIRDRCVRCHMHQSPADYATGAAAVTGHEFTPRVEACVECHADYTTVVDINDEANKFDYKGAQTTTRALIAQLEDLLANASSADSTTDRFLQAKYNLESVKAEGSFGIHNTQLVQKLLQDAIDRITLTDVTTDNVTPVEYTLQQNYPNPFNPTTTIRFNLPQAGNVKVTVYDAIGKEVETLFNNFAEAGSHQIEWNASRYSSGVYLYRMEAENFISIKKMLLVK